MKIVIEVTNVHTNAEAYPRVRFLEELGHLIVINAPISPEQDKAIFKGRYGDYTIRFED